ERDGAAIADEPFGVVIQGVVIPLGGLAGLDGGFEFFRDTLALFPLATLIAERHGDEVMGMGLVVWGLGDFEGILENLERNDVAVSAVVEWAGLRRMGKGPDDFQIALAGEVDVRGAGPPIKGILVVRPGAPPVARIAARPEIIAQRFLDFGPDAVMVFDALDVAVEDLELLAGVVELRGVGILRGGLGAPKCVGEAEIHPAFVGRRKFQSFSLFIGIMGLGE